MDYFKERSTRTYIQKQLYSKEELISRESRCVHEQPAFCAAACPMKLDARALIGEMQKGDFTAARALVERVAPFPLILACGCEAPCESACRMNEKGDGVGIGALERAAVRLGAAKAGRGLLKFKKKKTAAVFGADLFSLVLAAELDRKSYPTVFFVTEPDAAAVIAACAPFLGSEDAAEEAARLEAMDMRVEYGSALTPELLEAKRTDFDILAASRGFFESAFPGFAPDAVTLLCEESGVLTSSDGCTGVLGALFDARRAGVSADRLAQGLSPDNMRGEEGPVASKLYTNMDDAQPSRRVAEGTGYTRDQAMEEAGRCIRCRCEECMKHCVYLRHYDKFPRVLTREIYNNSDIIMGDHMMNRAMNSCSLCGQCTVTCPNGYDMAEICLAARENMVDTTKMSNAYHEFALLDMLFSNSEAFLARSQPGFERCRYVFFPGCQAGAVAPEAVYRACRDLQARLTGGVALMLGCCGAPAKWAGRRQMYSDTAEMLRSELHKLGDPVVIAGCPTCEKTLRELAGGEVVGVWDVLNDIGLPDAADRRKMPAVLHDSCSARGDREMQAAVRALAAKLGVELTDSPDSGDLTACCGYGGLVSQVNKPLASEMARACTPDADAVCITYCMACRDRFAREGRESMNLLELVYSAPAGAPPDISEKRRNRLGLRNRLLREIWGEDVNAVERGFQMEITPETRAKMDERMILEQDVVAVMEGYAQTGEAVFDRDTGFLTACRRIGNVTFWVIFTEDGGKYTVRGAYSHRMTVETR